MMEQKRFKVQIMNFTIGKRISAVFFYTFYFVPEKWICTLLLIMSCVIQQDPTETMQFSHTFMHLFDLFFYFSILFFFAQ